MQIFSEGFAELREIALREGRSHVSIETIRFYDDKLWNSFNADGASVAPACAGGVPCLWVDSTREQPTDVVIWFHGGGYAAGSAGGRRAFATELSRAAECRVLLPEYRLAPEYSFPAAVEDALATYRWLLERIAPSRIVLGGESAGGGLVVATMLAARGAGLPQPAGGVTVSPIVDWTLAADSHQRNAASDLFVNTEMLMRAREQFLSGHDERDPLASPLFGVFSGLAPLFSIVGSDEVLLDDSVRLVEKARAAGVDAELEIFEDMFHLWSMFSSILPEGREAIKRVAAFTRKRCT
jgi:acetyl esterase/lipase